MRPALLVLLICPAFTACDEDAPPTKPAAAEFATAAAEYCAFERPLVIADPIQAKNIAKREAQGGAPAAIRTEATWLPFCVEKQRKLKETHGEAKVMAYFECAQKLDSLVAVRTSCRRQLLESDDD